MVKLTTAILALTCALSLAEGRAFAQDGTATNTRRPTPVPTATRTATVAGATPTAPAGGDDALVCSRGTKDGFQCTQDDDCPGGVCVLTQGVCDGGSNDGDYCESADDCVNGACLATQRVCLAGDSKGVSCLNDGHCPGSECVSTGLFCDGGDFDLFSCVDDGGCTGTFEDGSCRSLSVFLCSSGPNDGDNCRGGLDCPGGACVVAQKICSGGEADGADCEGVYDCPGGECVPTAMICDAGENKSLGCLSSANCTGGNCVSTGKLCDGGVFESLSCVDSAFCSPAGEDPAACATPGPSFYCSNGANDGDTCASDDECPGGACVFSQGVCDGGNDGDLCDSNADCAGSLCVQTQKVCLAGTFEGVACIADRQCGSGILCGSSGLFCSGGDFDGLSCAVDENCCDDDGCSLTDTNDGACFAPSVFLCSGGANDNDACESHADCPNGACVEAQGVCDGGGDDFDGGGCQSSINCGGAPCVFTSHICIRNGTIDGETIEVEGFGCLRDDHCFGAGAGSCMATGQACDGGDTSASDYDPFALSLSCTDDQICRDFLGDNSLLCVAPSDRGSSCSAGPSDGNRCTSNAECSQGKCVLEDSLCAGGARDADLCDTNADCPGGTCNATWKVCENSGFSCVNASQCDNGEACISSGKVCVDSAVGPFSCVDDFNCFDNDNPDDPQGACVGVEERLCSFAAPCALDDLVSEDVFGFSVDPTTSPATFDFYLASIPDGAAAVSVVLHPSGGDADLYVGRELSTAILSTTDFPFSSNNGEDAVDVVTVNSHSTPTFSELTNGLDALAVVVGGVGGATSYTLDAVFLGASAAGDANCDATVNGADVDGLIRVVFDAGARIAAEASPFGRCVGGDGNDDGADSAADLIAAVRHIGTP